MKNEVLVGEPIVTTENEFAQRENDLNELFEAQLDEEYGLDLNFGLIEDMHDHFDYYHVIE